MRSVQIFRANLLVDLNNMCFTIFHENYNTVTLISIDCSQSSLLLYLLRDNIKGGSSTEIQQKY